MQNDNPTITYKIPVNMICDPSDSITITDTETFTTNEFATVEDLLNVYEYHTEIISVVNTVKESTQCNTEGIIYASTFFILIAILLLKKCIK